MSDVIKLLPDSVANQIAAGEVIQRPASVIKELVENAVDAGATTIQIILKDAGRTLIQVIDNGAGMTPTDARLAFERHSTSKISDAHDLFALRTMGFRGEALASIAAISHVELRTMARDASLGTRLLISASQCELQEPNVCPPGSNFMIKDLFYNVPARRKFLKSNQVELSNIIKELEKLAIVNHNIEISLSHNGNVLYHLLPGTLKQRIAAIWGHTMDDQLIPVAVETSLVRIHGFVCRPEDARRRNALQFFFVNGRFMKHPYFHKAIANCYEQLIPEGSHPNYFLIFEVEPDTIDVNIHPTKTEIKFENEVPIWQILSAAVKESLGRFNLVPSIDFDTDDAPVIPALVDHDVTPPSISADPSYNPFNTSSQSSPAKSSGTDDYMRFRREAVPTNWEDLYRGFKENRDDALEQALAVATKANDAPEPLQRELFAESAIAVNDEEITCIQLEKSYIITPVADGLLIVDQHRAHVMVLYHNYITHIKGKPFPSQSILFPEVMHLTPAQNALMLDIEPQLSQLGFMLSPLSGGDWSINATPGGLEGVNAQELIARVLETVSQGTGNATDDVYSRIALTIAERASISRNHSLTPDEMKHLVSDLMRIDANKYTPGGKLIMTVLATDQISKLF